MLDVLIIGAGPTGLAAAIELARLGKQVRIIDKNISPAQHIRATGVNPRTLMLLEPSGISKELLTQGIPVSHLFLRSGIQSINAFNFNSLNNCYNFMLSLPQNKIENTLIEGLKQHGIVVERQTELVSFTQNDQAVTVTISKQGCQETLVCAYLLGADGSQSAVRSQAGISFAGKSAVNRWSLLDAEMEWPFPQGNIFMAPGSLLIVLPVGEKRYCAVANQENIFSVLPPSIQVNQIHWQADFYVGSRLAETYQKGRIFLAGDAAHIFPPAGGRGMNLGIEDGILFARQLATNNLKTYATTRRLRAKQVTQDSNTLVTISTLQSQLSRFARDRILAPLVQANFIQQRFCWRLTGIRNSFTASVLMRTVRAILRITANQA